MKIKLTSAGKRYNREWIFRNANLEFESGNPIAITGANGSGKSTLLQCMAGMLQFSEGSMEFTSQGQELSPDQAYSQISFCAPYLELIEEMSLLEFLEFHNRFKRFLNGYDVLSIIEAVGLKHAAHKQIRYYSSGMKQRVKLAQCIYSDTAMVLLDEPCSNLDQKGIRLYHDLIQKHCLNRLLIVCSNDEMEYSFCNKTISIHDFKPDAGLV